MWGRLTELCATPPPPVLTEPPHYNEPLHIHRTLGSAWDSMHSNTRDHCTQIAPHKTLCLFTMDCDLDERMKQWKAASFWVVQQAQGRQVALQQPKLLPGASGSALIL